MSASCVRGAVRPVLAVLACVLVLPAGCQRSSGGGGGGGLVSTPTNDLTWSKTFGGPGVDRATAMAESPLGGYLVAGVTDDYDDGAGEIWAFRVDGAGDSIWSRTYGANGLRMHEVRSVAWHPQSGDLFLVGVELEDGVVVGVAVRMSSDRQVRWRRVLTIDEPQHVLPLPGGEVIVTGASQLDGAAAVVRLDGDGKALWEQFLGAGSAHVAALAPNGKIFVGGSHHGALGARPFFVAALDAGGGVAWSLEHAIPPSGLVGEWTVRSIEWTGAGSGYVAMGTWTLGPPEDFENGVFRVFGDEEGPVEDFALFDLEELTNFGSALGVDYSWFWIERLADGSYAATGGAYEDGVPAVPTLGHFDADFDMISSHEIVFAAPDDGGGAGTRIVERANGNIIALGQSTGITENIFYAELGPGETIVAQGITGAGFGTGVGEDLLLAVALVTNGDLCLAGRTDAGPNGLGAWLTFHTPDYTEFGEQYRKLDTVDDIRAAIANQAGDGFVLLGTTATAAFAVADTPCILVLEIDGEGTILWERALRTDDGFAERGVGICAHGDGYAVIGQSGPGVSIFTLDVDGVITGQARHIPPPFSDYRLTAGGIAAAPGDDLFIAGTLDAPAATSEDPQPIWVARLAPDLTQVWRSEVTSPIELKGFAAHPRFVVAGVQAVDAGCAVLATMAIDDLFPLDPRLFLLALDANGAADWSRLYLGQPGEDHAAGLARGADGTLTIAATTTSVGGGFLCDGASRCPNVLAMRVEETGGDIVWQRTYSTATSDRAHTVGVSPSGDFFLAGETDGVLGNVDYWAMRIDAAGEIDASCPSGIAETANLFAAEQPIIASGVAANESIVLGEDLVPSTTAIGRSVFEETRQCAGEGTDPAPIEFSVVIEIIGDGSVSSSTGESCPSTCELFVPAGTILGLTATPAAGAAFVGWGGDYAGTPVEVTADLAITATFGEGCGATIVSHLVEEWDEGWTSTEFDDSGSAFTDSARIEDGGAPGAYRRTYFALLAGESISTGQFAPAISVDPAAGPIQSIDFTVMVAQITALPAGTTITWRPAVRQGGTIYQAVGSQAAIASTAWTPAAALGLPATAFNSSTGASPSFAPGAPAIELGYVLRGTSAGPINHIVGVDTLQVTVNGSCP